VRAPFSLTKSNWFTTSLCRLLFSIMRKYPNIKKGHLYDLPDVVKNVVVPEDLSGRYAATQMRRQRKRMN